MPYIPPEIIIEAKKMDLLTYLKTYEPRELVKLTGNTYCTREHDSLKISNGKWMWWSRGIGGISALDYLIRVKGLGFIEAVESIMGKIEVTPPIYEKKRNAYENMPFLLPKKSPTSDVVFAYLRKRGIEGDIIKYCLEKEIIMESLPYHNVVFIGYDEKGEAKYGAYRVTNEKRIMGDCSGSQKEYSFRIMGGNTEEVHLFESAIDLLSYATLCKLEGKNWREMNLISLSGVYAPKSDIKESKVPVTVAKFLKEHSHIKRIVLHFDKDFAGRKATLGLKNALPSEYEVVDDPPIIGKDFNDFLCIKRKMKENKFNEEGDFER